ncbi:hypothetical protein FTUN_8068 [Frigoriglobus tundricola]|uniref:Uncharacterized protein n=1 Tax=Frigoriglobus tundricola TaxID=2774151 RepID=A0A6M5Z1X7_9BACT|nr:hypothetical protein FTUN_8068 [Frigoriglobus tundricola]
MGARFDPPSPLRPARGRECVSFHRAATDSEPAGLVGRRGFTRSRLVSILVNICDRRLGAGTPARPEGQFRMRVRAERTCRRMMRLVVNSADRSGR